MSTVIGKIRLLLTFFSWLTQYCTTFDFRIDSLVIYDGDSNTSPMLGNPYCGDPMREFVKKQQRKKATRV